MSISRFSTVITNLNENYAAAAEKVEGKKNAQLKFQLRKYI
jgi:hypothetical protein